jgi:hypothetical protein
MTMRPCLPLAFVAACNGGSQDKLAPDAPDPLACGAGTIEQNGTCLPARHFELRIEETELGANGHTRRRIVAFGTEPDGSPVEELVTLGVDRASAGSLTDTMLHLGRYGATTFFTPCAASDPACLGPAQLTLALAGAPQQPVARVAIALVPATEVSSVAPCVDHDQIVRLDGNDFIADTLYEADEGAWTVSTMFSNSFSLQLDPAVDANLGRASLIFETVQLGVPMNPGIFTDAQRAEFASPGHPGLDITSQGRGCNTLSGSFQIHHYTRATSTSKLDILVSFEQHCELGVPLAEGCLRYTP